MKKSLIKKAIIFASLILIFNFSFGQAFPCTNISVQIFGLNPQTGSKNYFGFTISFDKPFDQNVTVNGYIYDEGEYNINHPFSVTVQSGQTSFSTSTTYYETNPTASAAIVLSSTSPSVISTANINYSTECNFGSYSDVSVVLNPNNSMDYIGSHHNSGCDFVRLGDISSASAIKNRVSLFLTNIGYSSTDFDSWYSDVTTNGLYSLEHTKFADNPDSLINLLYSNSYVTSNAKSYLHSMVSLIKNTIGENEPSASLYYNIAYSLISLESTILNDNNLGTIEKSELLACCSVKRFSAAYWTNYSKNNLIVNNASNNVST